MRGRQKLAFLSASVGPLHTSSGRFTTLKSAKGGEVYMPIMSCRL